MDKLPQEVHPVPGWPEAQGMYLGSRENGVQCGNRPGSAGHVGTRRETQIQ